jgi:GNAT superfamily N-acetyltransferase
VEGARPANFADVPRMAELWRLARTELEPERGGALYMAREARPEPVHSDFESAIADRSRQAWVGTIDEHLIGYLVAHVEDLRDGRRLGVVEDIFVEPGARSVGVGEAMMDLAMPWFRDHDCAGVDAHALPGMRETKNFFETFGFTARLLVVHHKLES